MPLEHIAVIVSITWLAVIIPGADFAIIARNRLLTLFGVLLFMADGVPASL